jgi:UDP-2,3-diacylglucosamine hydrolase
LRRLYLADLHLEDPEGAHFSTLAALLERAQVDECWFLGDLCEVWVGDDDDGPLAIALQDLLRRASRRFCVKIMVGNRDFLISQPFAAATGIELVADPYIRPDGVLLAHGDAFCVDDAPYQQMRALLRSAAWRDDVLSQSLENRRALATLMRAQSRAANADKTQMIMDVNATALADVMRQFDADVLVHGHTHRPAVHRSAWGSRFVLGDWGRVAWALWEPTPREFRLECLPLVGRSTVKSELGIR